MIAFNFQNFKDISSSSNAMFNESVDFGYLSLETVTWSACRKNIHVHENQNLLWMLSQETSIEAEKQPSYCGSTYILLGAFFWNTGWYFLRVSKVFDEPLCLSQFQLGTSPLGNPGENFFERANPGHPGNFFCLIPCPGAKNYCRIPRGWGKIFPNSKKLLRIKLAKVLKKRRRLRDSKTTRKSLNIPALIFN